MGAEATLKLLLLGEDRSAGKALRGVGGDADKTRGKFGQLAKVSAVALAGGLLAAGAAAIKLGRAAAADEQAAVRLATSLKNSAGATDEQVAATEKWITAQGKALGVTDDELRPALGRLAIATKDVGEAQDYAALAMDVAAGSGKSLDAVSAGLAKAINGNVGALARLNINTKNADGSTKSLEQVTADLAQTYSGQAAKAADTTAGKQKILETRMNELGETMGQKVQPVMLAVTDAALKLADEFENGTGTGGDIRDVLEDVADAGKAVKGAIDAIPGPVKKFGAEAAIALLVVSKLRTLMGPMSVGLTTMATSFKSAETRAAGFKAGLRGLGSGLTNVAGAGGMLLLADGAGKAETSMGKLELAAGGAMSGAALGSFAGPPGAAVGAAIGGIAGLTFGLLQRTKEVQEQVLHGIPSWKEYAQTLDGTSAATTKATRAMVLQRLEKSGLLDATRKLGLTDRQAVSAMMGNTDARKKLSKELAHNHNLTDEQRAALVKETGAVGQSRKATLLRNIALAGTEAELKKAKTALRNFMKEPANKRVNISGVEQASQQLRDLRTLLSQTLNPPKGSAISGISGSVTDAYGGAGFEPKKAVGGPINTSGWYRIQEGGVENVWLPAGANVASAIQTDRMARDGSAAQSVMVEVNFNGVVGDPRQAARQILSVLKDHGVTTGAAVNV